MGQKVHPTGIRLGIVKKHTSVWYAEGEEYANNLLVDLQVRDYCLLYTSDAADDLLCVDLGGRRIIKKRTIYRSSFIEEGSGSSRE